jgi:hypothetical protein
MPADRRQQIALFWHIHQPFFVPDSELAEQAVESYLPMLELHERLEIPFSLNVSGGLLVRLELLAPELVERLRGAARAGLIEILASGAFHPMLPLLPLERARRQIAFDVEAKQRILGVSPRGFWPADLGFSQFLVPLLAEAGVDWTVVDGSGRLLGSSLPGWEPKLKLGQAVLAPRIRPLLCDAELGRAVLLRVGESLVTALSRHPALTWRLIDLEAGLLQDAQRLDAFMVALSSYWDSGAELCVIGDDGERLNGRTLRSYEALLRALPRHGNQMIAGSAAAAMARAGADEVYLPTSTFLVDLDAWLSTADDWICFRLLDELHRELQVLETFARMTRDQKLGSELREIGEAVLPIEDSAFYFWKFLRRTREPFVERIHALRRRMAALGTAGVKT